MNNRYGTLCAVAVTVLGIAFGATAGCGNNGGTGTNDATAPEAAACISSTQVVCGGECSDLQKDPTNCGACGTVCGAGQVCSRGKCATSCGGGTMQCGQSCTLLQDDPQNCGACGKMCATGQVCAAGKCASTCGGSQAVCAGNCVDLQNDDHNCGMCGNVCPSGEVCSSGSCGVTCQAGLTLCQAPIIDGGVTDSGIADGGIVDAATDSGTDDAATDSGIVDAATDSGPILTYPYCANLQSDNLNCGACSNPCSFPDTCISGTCKPIVSIRVAVEGGGFYTDNLRTYLASAPGIISATEITACDTATLSAYDVVIVYGNMSCFNDANYTAYVNGGGGLIGTPWVNWNNGGITALPVTVGTNVKANHATTLNVTVSDSTDPLLAGVTFNGTDTVGYEQIGFTLNTGATSSVYWNDSTTTTAVAKWAYGAGRAVYLDFQYITSDSSPATFAWSKQLMYNAVLWAAKRE